MAKNSYVLGKRIARGGMAEIYMGKAIGEAAFQRICAIKRILPHYAQDKEFVQMFRDEAHICKRLQHANIVQVYDFTEVDGSYALIMEHVNGCDLRTLLSTCEASQTRLTVPMALYIAACSAKALHYAHTKSDEITKEALGIVHRDVSPQNILLSYEGEVKITDFGIASAENKITETRPGVVKGKYSYMSPEQVAAHPLDGRSDTFSLAIVLWEALAMKRLFSGRTEVESIRKVQECNVDQDLRELNPDVNDELYTILMKALSKERKDRYQSAGAFEKEITKFLNRNYSDFNSSELGDFLKKLLASKRDKSHDDIKETLSKRSAAEPVREELKAVVNDDDTQMGRGLARTTAPVTNPPSFMGSGPNTNHTGAFRSGGRNNTSTISAQFSRTQVGMPSPVYKKRAKRRDMKSVMMINLGLVAVLALGFILYKSPLFNSKLNIKVSTQPAITLITVNGKRAFNGYTKTPATIGLKPGSYILEFSRPGYLKERFKVSSDSPETKVIPKIILRRSPLVKMSRVNIKSQKPVQLSIDNGLYRGTSPMEAELSSNQIHSITFQSLEKENTKAFKCNFKTDRGLSPKPSTIVISFDSKGRGRCVVR